MHTDESPKILCKKVTNLLYEKKSFFKLFISVVKRATWLRNQGIATSNHKNNIVS